MEILLGCGHSRIKKMYLSGRAEWENLCTLDCYYECEPDIIHDLNQLPLPFTDNSAEEMHLYEVLEHTGKQGDYEFFFEQFTDFWRILKHGGFLFAQCPSYKSIWAYGDPSHTRVLNKGNLPFLSQKEYIRQIDIEKRAMTDFRRIYKADFDIMQVHEDDNSFNFVLRAVKEYNNFG